MNQFTFSFRLLLAVFYFLPLLSHGQAGTMNDPIVLPILYYSDSRSNLTYQNTYSRAESPYFGQPSPDIFYRFTVRAPGELKVSTCGSDFNTYIHLLAHDGTPLEHNDDNGFSCVGTTASMSVNLNPGTYYLVMEGSGSATGVIKSLVMFLGQLVPIDTTSPIHTISPINPDAPVAPETRNFVRVWEVLSPQRDAGALMLSGSREVRQSTTYHDGLGRPMQTVIKAGSLSGGVVARDLVTPMAYDSRGRQSELYLPYADGASADGSFKENAFAAQTGFYSSASSPLAGQGESHFYSRTVFEPSPLGRTSAQMAPGTSWVGAGRGTSTSREVNTPADSVRLWEAGPAASAGDLSSVSSAGVYAPGTLYKTITTDEAGKQVVEFTDLEGRVVLKKVQGAAVPTGAHQGWLLTYYIYDDLERLRAVLQPAAVEALASQGSLSWTPDSVMLSELAFRYGYDSRGRMTIKKVPGAGAVFLVYDARDRLVMTQDAGLRKRGSEQWMLTRYDQLNRPIATGLWKNSQDLSYHLAEAYNSASYPSAVLAQDFDLLTETHYDDYQGLPAGLSPALAPGYAASLNASSGSPEYAEAVVSSTRTKGLVTWSSTKVLRSGKYLVQATIYDDKARPLQTQSTNHTGGTDVVTTQYDFSGRVLRSHGSHQKGGPAPQGMEVATKNLYDPLGRITSIEKNINHSGWKGITSMEYDPLGQLRQKKLAPGYANGQGLETLTYDYNIRGWLLGVNRSYLLSKNTLGYAGHFFGLELGYDKPASASGATFASPQFNGNIAGTLWKSAGDEARRKYDFSYDAASRFAKADFTQNTDPSAAGPYNITSGNFSVHGPDPTNGSLVTYDANGNILSMVQHGTKTMTPDAVIDNLSYSYYPHSNKLRQVTDQANDKTSTLGDFKYDPATKAGADYGYDPNGNLVTDLNKKLEGATGIDLGSGPISYNHLNLPESITVTGRGSIEYSYDASGNKLSKTVHETGRPDKVTLYLGAMVYENDSLQFFSHEEGRIRPVRDPNGQVTAYGYDYFIKDHLGNVRMVLTDQQTQDAYPAASLETATLAQEKVFYQVPEGASRISKTSVPAYPKDDRYTSPNDYLQKLNGSAQKLGTSIVLKVMSGDRVNIRVTSWYRQNGPVGAAAPASGVVADIAASLVQGLAGVPGPKGTIITPGEQQGLSGGIASFLSQQKDQASSRSKPKSYLNWLLVDEQLNPVITSDGKNSGSEQVGPDQQLTLHQVTERELTKNGYLYIYLSNETPGTDVFFDNLQVTHIKGPLLEETHYYPFGLTMAAISFKAAGGMENRRKYNGIEFNDDLDLNTYDAFYRNLDPQIGRWWEIDPKVEGYESISPYASMYDDPVRHSDPLGDEAEDPGIGSVSLNFVKGVGQSIWGTIKGIGNVVAHPIQTADAIGTAIAHPINTISSIGDAISATYSEFKNGDGDVKASILGKAVGEIGQALVGVAEVKAGIKIAKGSKLAEEATLVAKTSKEVKSLGNPFKNASLEEVRNSFEKRVAEGTMEKRGPNAYVNKKSGYSYNVDKGGTYGKKGKKVEEPHIDVNRPNPKPKNLPPKRKLNVQI